MVIDTSAVIAILQQESSALALTRAIEADPVRLMSAASAIEAGIVIERRHGDLGGARLDQFLGGAAVEIVPVGVDHVGISRLAWRRFGRGRHRAGLNFGDCFAYALAITSGERLLFVGDDFGHTDVPSVL